MRLVVFCAVVCALAASASRAQSYEVVDLQAGGEATAINSHNDVVGTGSTGVATLWRDGTTIELGGGPIIPNSTAVGINDAGQVTGSFVPGDLDCSSGQGCSSNGHAYLYTPGATDGISNNPQMKDLGVLSGSTDTQATAINARGQVAGVAMISGAPGDRPFLWTPGAVDGDPANPEMKELPLPPGIPDGFPQAINDAGEMVGVGFDSANDSHTLYWHDGIVEDLGPGAGTAISNETPPVVFGEDLFGIFAWKNGVPQYLNLPPAVLVVSGSPNAAGEFVGATYTQAYAYQGGGFHLLPGLDGMTDAIARSINDAGWIVGRMFVGDEQHAVLWRHPQLPTPVGENVTVSGNGVSLTFAQVTAGGVTTLSSDTSGQATPGGFMAAGLRYDIWTSAVYVPPLDVCVTYDPAALAPGAESTLRFMHFQQGAWADVTTSVDTANAIICGRTQSLSPFALITPDDVPPTIAIHLSDWALLGSPLWINFDLSDNSALFIEAHARFDGVPVLRNASITPSQPGWHTLSVDAKDAAGNAAHASSRIYLYPPGLNLDASVAVTTLWPPDGRLVDVGLQVRLVDTEEPAATYQVSVTSDDPGGAQPQWQYSDGVLLLRAQRSGRLAAGRTYTIQVYATDSAGRAQTRSLTVQVPHSLGVGR
jgi:uncharacterized membrane protein